MPVTFISKWVQPKVNDYENFYALKKTYEFAPMGYAHGFLKNLLKSPWKKVSFIVLYLQDHLWFALMTFVQSRVSAPWWALLLQEVSAAV